jgi:hypothetical protein
MTLYKASLLDLFDSFALTLDDDDDDDDDDDTGNGANCMLLTLRKDTVVSQARVMLPKLTLRLWLHGDDDDGLLTYLLHRSLTRLSSLAFWTKLINFHLPPHFDLLADGCKFVDVSFSLSSNVVFGAFRLLDQTTGTTGTALLVGACGSNDDDDDEDDDDDDTDAVPTLVDLVQGATRDDEDDDEDKTACGMDEDEEGRAGAEESTRGEDEGSTAFDEEVGETEF